MTGGGDEGNIELKTKRMDNNVSSFTGLSNVNVIVNGAFLLQKAGATEEQTRRES